MKKGFTLIELLAVIVILAIIALIAIPQITKVVDEAKKGAAVSSAYGYIDAVEKYMMTSKLSSNKAEYELKDNIYDVIKESNNIPGLNTFIKINGEKPVKGSVTIEKGKVKKAEFGLKGYRIVCQNDKCNVIGTYEEITITYNLNGGTLDKTSEKVYKGDSLLLPTPLKTDYIFDGWYTELNGGVKVTDETTFNNAQTLYAHWTKKMLSSLSVKTMPNKTVYNDESELLDLTGLEVLATYNDGEEIVLGINDIVLSPANNSKLTRAGENKITINYTSNGRTLSTSFNVLLKNMRFEQNSLNTLDSNGYDGNLETYTYTTRINIDTTVSGYDLYTIPKLFLPENAEGNVLNVKYMLDQRWSSFEIVFFDADKNVIGHIHNYINQTLASDDNLSLGSVVNKGRRTMIIEDIQPNNVLLTANLVIPKNAKCFGITMIDTNHGAKIYDTYITAP